MPKIQFVSFNEKDLAEAFVKLVRVGKVSCLPNNTYLISDDMYSYIIHNYNDFPSFVELAAESEVIEYPLCELISLLEK